MLEGGLEYDKAKKWVLKKISMCFYQKEFSYLEFIQHAVTDCFQSKQVLMRCPVPKCTNRKKMTFTDLRSHLMNDCAKIILECTLCKGQFKRPKQSSHDCRRVYIQKLKDIEQLNQEMVQSKNEVIAEKDKQLEYLAASGIESKFGKHGAENLKVPLTVNLDSRHGFRTDFHQSEHQGDFFDDDKKSREAQSIGGLIHQKDDKDVLQSLNLKIDL